MSNYSYIDFVRIQKKEKKFTSQFSKAEFVWRRSLSKYNIYDEIYIPGNFYGVKLMNISEELIFEKVDDALKIRKLSLNISLIDFVEL